MKKIVRTGVFETNSSSSHSLSVANSDQEFVLDTLYPDQFGVIRVEGKQFGWGWEKSNDAETKLAYAFQDSFGQDDLIKEVVMEQTGANEVIFNEGDGYIDHEGVGTTNDIRNSKEDMRNFIFNKNSWLFIGNDNSDPDPTFFHVPEYKDGRLIQPEYKYELSIEGWGETTKFLNYPTDEEINIGMKSITDDVYLTKDGHFFKENTIFWKIQKPRNTYYTMDGWDLAQDYSTNEVRFLKEDDERWRQISDKPEMKGVNWDMRSKLITEEAMKAPGLIKTVKFTLKKLF